MLKKSFFILGCVFSTILGFSQAAAPPIEEIAEKFYNTYQDTYQGAYITFEKRSGQWKIGTLKQEGSHWVPGRSFLFFDSDSGGYQKLPFERKTDSVRVDFRQRLDDHQVSDYHLHEYFGYNGWYKDVIAHLSHKDHLSDFSLYSLARAYSNYASCLLANQTGDAIESEIFQMLDRYIFAATQPQFESKPISLSVGYEQ